MIYRIALIGVAGMLGTLSRYWMSGWVTERFGETFPWGTLTVNAAGCFLIGAAFYLTEERLLLDPAVRLALLIGFLGGFTTFSSFGVQTFTLLRDGELLLAAAYVFLSNGLGLLMVWLGYQLSRLW